MAKSSAYPPLDSLVDLACRDGVDIRPTLLRVLTDLYVQKPAHSAEEETQYVELARGLIDAVDAATLAIAARRLAPASSEVIRRLENAALQRNPGEFSRMLERALGQVPADAERIARDA